jgi:hypothetical protein
MVRMLAIIEKTGGTMPTEQLLHAAGSWGRTHENIKKAEREGYIIRKVLPQKEGLKGNDFTMNTLTQEGHMLLALAREVGI